MSNDLIETIDAKPIERDHYNHISFEFNDGHFALIKTNTQTINRWRDKILNNENFEIVLDDKTTRYIINVNNLTYMKVTKRYA